MTKIIRQYTHAHTHARIHTHTHTHIVHVWLTSEKKKKKQTNNFSPKRFNMVNTYIITKIAWLIIKCVRMMMRSEYSLFIIINTDNYITYPLINGNKK